MRVFIVGAGQMGSIYAAAAHENGHDVRLVDASEAVVDAVTKRGLIIERQSGSRDVYRLPITAEPARADGPADLILFQTKGYATHDAAQTVRAIVGPNTLILTLQNGLGNEEALREILPEQEILIGMSVHTVVTIDVAHYSHTGVRDTHLGPSKGDDLQGARIAASVLEHPDFPVEVLPEQEIRRAQWAKFVLNCASLPTMALTRLPTAAASGEAGVFALMDDITRETCDIAKAAGVDLDKEERVAFQHDLFRTAGGRASMLGDVLAHRRTEVETINGAALRYADQLGLPAPLNKIMYTLVKGLEKAIEIGEA